MRTLAVLVMAATLSTCSTAPVLAAPKKAVAPKHDCGVFYMGAGGYIFSGPLVGVRATFQARYPSAWTTLNHHWGASVPAGCRNPLIAGHSLGAIRAVSEGNALRRGRVVSIDPPDWYTTTRGLRATRPTVNFFHCPPSPFGCGRVTGTATNVDLSGEGWTHVPLPNSKRVHQEVAR